MLNTIAQGGPAGADIVATTLGTGTATVNTNHSEYTKVVPSGPGAAINTSVTDQHTPPVFVPGSYREAATSVSTIGKGAVDPDNGPFDLDGDLRTTGGVTDIGADQYVTPPSVTALAGSSHDGHGTLTATVDTHGSPTNYLVHYGPTPAYGSASATLSLPASASPAAVSIPLTGLDPWRDVPLRDHCNQQRRYDDDRGRDVHGYRDAAATEQPALRRRHQAPDRTPGQRAVLHPLILRRPSSTHHDRRAPHPNPVRHVDHIHRLPGRNDHVDRPAARSRRPTQGTMHRREGRISRRPPLLAVRQRRNGDPP